MDFIEYKKQVINLFKQNNIDNQEVNIIFMEALNLDRMQLLVKKILTKKEEKILAKCIKQRLKGKPIQKIFGRAYFYGLQFFVNKHVLCPRPETEILVETVLGFKKQSVLDLCTGSGAIAVSLAKNGVNNIVASDISTKALCVAKKNAKHNGVKITFAKSNLFAKIKQKFDCIVSNPPYIPSKEVEQLDVEVKKHDPKISLDGGEDGLDFYKKIASQAKKHLNKNGLIAVEVGYNQAQTVKNIFEQNGFACFIKKDYNDIERIVVGELKW